MRPSKRPIIIATRSSGLARTQAGQIADLLRRLHPKVHIELLPIESQGDQMADQPLARVGGKGLFTRSIEQALLDRRADLAVHSLKDLPVKTVAGLVVAATPARAPAHDVLISRDARSISALRESAVVGTSSFRRAAQLKRMRPDLRIESLRGNVETRMAKVLDGAGAFDATLLAAAGLIRAGLKVDQAHAISVDEVLPAAGQAALALQCRADDHVTLRRCLPLNHADTSAVVHAERTVIEKLGADCTAPVAVYAQLTDAAMLRLRARVLSPDGTSCVEADETGPARSSKTLIRRVVKKLTEQGAKELLAAARSA